MSCSLQFFQPTLLPSSQRRTDRPCIYFLALGADVRAYYWERVPRASMKSSFWQRLTGLFSRTVVWWCVASCCIHDNIDKTSCMSEPDRPILSDSTFPIVRPNCLLMVICIFNDCDYRLDLDRSNISNAYVSGMREELNMVGTEFNVSSSSNITIRILLFSDLIFVRK